MTPEAKAIIIQALRDIADAWEAESPEDTGPDFENDVTVILDNPGTVWTDNRLVMQWLRSEYGKSYKKLRDIVRQIAEERGYNFTTSFIPDDTIEVVFIIPTLNQGRAKKDAK